jgi:predicted 3-demethylubiquinone-9 3-methyltransferase (glyoxalase superfamily)
MTISNHKITPFLWFDTQAEEAAKFYTSIFKDSKILDHDSVRRLRTRPQRQRHDGSF